MNTIISDIITENPWGCTSYTPGGETLPAVQKSSAYYSRTVVYENTEGKQVGRLSVRAGTSGAFDTIISASWQTLHLLLQWVELRLMTVQKMDSV